MSDNTSDWEVRNIRDAKIEKAIAEAEQDRLAYMSRCGEITRPNSGPPTSLDREGQWGLPRLIGGFLRLLQVAARLHLR